MKIAVHNTVQLTDDEVRSRFVVRTHELDDLLVHLRDADPPRHALVIAPRGMGKSLLLRRLAVAVADDDDLVTRWLPVLMPEELYEVTSVGELWLAALDRLADLEQDPDLAAQHAALRSERDPTRLTTLALERLLAGARARGRRVLLLAENVDMLLDKQVDEQDAWALRQALQTERDLLFVASAVTPFAGVEDEGEAFYGFFHRIDLRPLDDDEVRTLWHEITGIDLRDTRAAAVRIVTGGNPRLVAVLAQFTTQPRVRGLRESIELLIDEYTPYFKANIEVLPPVERKVLATLADIWAPATAAEVADRARMDSNGVSSLLGRLVQRGVIEVVDKRPGRRLYQVRERLYNLYHLLRRPDGEGRVRALVHLLNSLYEPVDLERDVLRGMLLPDPGAPSSAVDTAVTAELWRRLESVGIWADMSPTELAERLPAVEAILETHRAKLGDTHEDTLRTCEQVALLAERAGRPRTALRTLAALASARTVLLGVDHPDTLTSRHFVAYFTGLTGDPYTALALFRAVTADRERVLGAEHPHTLTGRHHVAYYIGETGDPHTALALYRAVAADRERVLGPDHPDTLTTRHNVAYYTGVTGDPHAALALLRAVATDCERVLGPNHPGTLTTRHNVAYFTGETGDPALALYRAVAADCKRVLGPDHPDTLGTQHNVAHLTGRTGDPHTALDLYRAVAADRERILGPDHPDTLTSRHEIAYYTGKTGDPHTALDLNRAVTADRARILGPDHPDTLDSRYEIVYSTAQIGDLAAALQLAVELASDAERALPDDHAVLRAVRALRARLEARIAAASGQRLPREVEEALRVADETGR